MRAYLIRQHCQGHIGSDCPNRRAVTFVSTSYAPKIGCKYPIWDPNTKWSKSCSLLISNFASIWKCSFYDFLANFYRKIKSNFKLRLGKLMYP